MSDKNAPEETFGRLWKQCVARYRAQDNSIRQKQELADELQRHVDARLRVSPRISEDEQVEAERLVLKVLDEMPGRGVRRTHPGSDPETTKATWNIYARDDVQATFERVLNLVKQGRASPQLLISWRRHLASERHQRPPRCPECSRAASWDAALPLRWRKVFDDIEIEIHPTLGPDVAGATLVSPSQVRVILGEDAVFDDLEAEFIVYRLMLHALITDLASAGFGCWIEPRAELDRVRLESLVGDVPDFRESEVLINDIAAWWMYDFYSGARRCRNIVRSLLRLKLTTTPVIRAMFRERSFLRRQVVRALGAVSNTMAGKPLLSTLRPKPRFPRQLAIVRSDTWDPPYLVWTDEDGKSWRRRIPSRQVVYALGLCLDFVASITQEQLSQYRSCGILIDPEEVRAVHAVLDASSGRGYLPLPGRGGRWDEELAINASLAGLSHKPTRHYLILAD